MATYTSHYNLKKPATSDKIRIADFNGNADIIDGQMYENASLGAQLKSAIGIVENTNTATHNISEGNFVIWKGVLKVASSAISTGATLSDANLSSVPNGGLNALNGKITNYVTTENQTISNVTIPAGESGGSLNVAKTGYKFLGIVGYALYGASYCWISRAIIESVNTISYNFYNDSGSSKTASSVIFICLYVKT